MTIPASIGFAGSSVTYNSTTGYRPLAIANFLVNNPKYLLSHANIAYNGWATFPNLVSLADLAAYQVLVFDNANQDNTENDAAHYEAFVRKAFAANHTLIALISPTWAATTNDQIDIPTNETAITYQRAICTAYGLPYIDFWAMCQALVPATYDLTDLFADTVHPTTLGYQLIEAALQPYLPLGGASSPATLPARIHADTVDYEETPTITLGKDYDSKTGTWTVTGDSIASAEVGATITFSGTFRTFACFNSIATYPQVTITIDGGVPFDTTAFYPNGYDTGSHGPHTIVITVKTVCTIDEFIAI